MRLNPADSVASALEYLKKTEYTGCHQGMRYRLEGVAGEEGKKLRCTVWPEPFNFFKTPEEEKEVQEFSFDEDGVVDAILITSATK